MNFDCNRPMLFENVHGLPTHLGAIETNVVVLDRRRRGQAVTGVKKPRARGAPVGDSRTLSFEPLDGIAGIFNGGHSMCEIKLPLPRLIMNVKIDEPGQYVLAVSPNHPGIFG